MRVASLSRRAGTETEKGRLGGELGEGGDSQAALGNVGGDPGDDMSMASGVSQAPFRPQVEPSSDWGLSPNL